MAGPVATEAEPGTPEVTGGPFGKKGIAWAIFEFARNPYYNLIVIYVFAPYFAEFIVGANVLASGELVHLAPEEAAKQAEARGQALVARTILIAGLIMAFVAPVMGHLSDQGVLRKPPTVIALAVLAITAFSLWWVTPGLPLAIPIGMALMAIGYVAYTVSELLHNSMLPDAGEPKALPLISGLGLALGNGAGVTVLITVLVLFALPGSPILPDGSPAFGIDQAAFEDRRIAGPIVALWLIVFVVPFFMFMPDTRRHSQSWRQAIRSTFFNQDAETRRGPVQYARDLFEHLRGLFQNYPNVMRFLVGRMIYADGITAVLTISATYVATFIGYSFEEVLVLGIISSTSGALGAFVGGLLDRTFGPKRALQIELSSAIVLMTFMLSVTPQSIIFGLVSAEHTVWNGPLYQSLAELTYFAVTIPASIMLVACISSSRYMLTHIAPREKIGEFYGFYAMAGNVTVWMGPGLVDLLTTVTGDQRIGMSGLGLLFIAGLYIVSGVKADKTPEHLKSR